MSLAGCVFADPASARRYVIEDRPCDYDGLVSARISATGEEVLVRAADLGTRLDLLVWPGWREGASAPALSREGS